MKIAPLAKGERFSESRIDSRHAEDTAPTANCKPSHHPEDRPERSSPYFAPHGFHTEEELAEFIAAHETEGWR